MLNTFLICLFELRHSRKISAKQAESAIINAGLSTCVCVGAHSSVCAFWYVWFMRLAGSLALRALHFFIRLPKQRQCCVHFLEQFNPPLLVEIHHTLVGGHRKYFFCFYTALFFPSSALFFSVCLSFLTACLDLTFGFVSFDDFWIVLKVPNGNRFCLYRCHCLCLLDCLAVHFAFTLN